MVNRSYLIVDDSQEFLASATRLLSQEGVAVVGQATTGREALHLAETLRPAVTLVDVELGGEDGIELAQQIAAEDWSPYVLLISLRDGDELFELIDKSSLVGFICKEALSSQAVENLITNWREA